jgi:iron complex outermembrane receptor protein
VTRDVRSGFLALACAGLMASVSHQACAQSSNVPSALPPAPATAAAVAASDQIVVTGSRIARKEFAAPVPIVSFDAAAIEGSGNVNLTNFLERVPALTGSRDFTQTSGGNAVFGQPFGGAGLNELNLRNLGVNRTLVLVDGRRHVAGEPNTAAVDINSIPTDLIERVDVLTGAVSAIYGADGVTGVVNFILKRDLDGVRARSQFGISSRGDAGNRFASIAAGKNFSDGKGNITVAFEYNEDDPLANDQRDYLRENQRQYLIPNDASTPANGLPHNILVKNLRYGNESPIGAVSLDGGNTFTFNGLGLPYQHGAPAAYYTTGGDDTPVAGFYSGDLAPQIRRTDVNVLSHYDFSDAFKVSLEGKYAETRATTSDYFNSVYFQPITLDNPFLPATIRNAAVAAGDSSVIVNRDNIDYPRHGETDLRKTYRGVIDLAGRIGAHATYDAYAEYGQTDVDITKLHEVYADRYGAAVDVVTDPATGQPVCRSNLNPAAAMGATTFTPGPNSGCQPVNLFGPGPISSAALGFFDATDLSHASISQTVGNASVNGDFGRFFRLPGGPIQFSFGGEYRRETSRFDPSANLVNNAFLTNGNEPSVVTPSSGSFDVKEAFGELNAPILTDRPFAKILSVGAAYRFSHYSTAGNTNTYQFNGIYAPVRDISFRGSYGEAVRAPNIGELFQPATGTGTFLVDPCTPQEINNGTQYRKANCTALLAQYGVVSNGSLQTGNIINGTLSGNTGLKPETARTWTAGVVLRPHWFRGLTASLDWYNIDLRGAIQVVDPSALTNLCVDLPTTNNPFCASITRYDGTQIVPGATKPVLGQVVGFAVQPQNVARLQTAGADLNVDYVLHTRKAGIFDVRFVGGYLNKLSFIGIPGAVPDDQVDQLGRPQWNFNLSPTWTLGNLTISYNLRWIDATRTQSKATTDADPNYAPAAQLRYSELWQHDVQIEGRIHGGASVYGGVLNLTDQRPDPGNSINAPISAVGRYLYVGIKFHTR